MELTFMTLKRPLSKKIESLINVSYGILKIYDNLTDHYNNQEEYNKYLEYLKLALKMENEIYTEIGEETLKTPEFSYEFTHYLNSLIENSDKKKSIPFEDTEEIKYRFNNYLSCLAYRYPFTSIDNNPIYKVQINYNTIEQHYFLEYDLLFLTYLNKYIEDSSIEDARQFLYYQKHQLLYRTKFFDNYAFIPKKELQPSAKDRLLLFKHNPLLVEKVFNNITTQNLNQAVLSALNYGNTEQYQEDFENLLIDFINIQTCLDISSTNLLFSFLRDYYLKSQNDYDIISLINTSTKVDEQIKMAFKEAIEKRNVKIKQKTSN